MQLALLASTFATVFLAELGDKTQLAIVTISGTSSRPTAVFAGSSVALVLASLLGAAAGGSLSSVVPTDLLQLVASLGFLLIGLRLIQRSKVSEDDQAAGEALVSDDLVRVEAVAPSGQEPPA
ncbi:TMEM165/GDT1 family protein [Synechococcus sp. CCY9202]|uniref:TMEM165/GDT1 family protein n=1 Tax=Synechococcus sp. CCY9202 TaxID=174698 RepID=UPI002B1FBDEF|nr:TMEM165/GDT1 family protein [Synechococcus sp. CCY9202]MEA5423214.1 TMEM165/GDT1 family protein [Synechococcus sp. CCY9202]